MRHLLLLVLLCGPLLVICAGDSNPNVPNVIAAASKPFLGVNVDENAVSFDPSQGLPVTNVIAGSSAAAMGIEVGDLLKKFNGQELKSQDALKKAIGSVKVGDQVTIELIRKTDNGMKTMTVNGVIAVKPQIQNINKELAEMREQVLELRKLQEDRKGKELSLVDMLKMLKQIEDNLPAAVAEFKKQYPKGEFNIQIKIDIVSDKTAKDPIKIGNQPGAQLNGENANAPVSPEGKSLPPATPSP